MIIPLVNKHLKTIWLNGRGHFEGGTPIVEKLLERMGTAFLTV